MQNQSDAGAAGKKLTGFGLKGWGIILYCMGMLWFQVGMLNDGTNILAPAIAEATGLDYSLVLSMGTIAGLVGFILFIVWGQVNVKLGPRKTSALALILTAISYALLGNAGNLPQIAIFWCLVTGCAMACGYCCGASLVANWFPKKKGIVMGYTTMGSNFSSALFVPLLAFCVTTFGVERGVFVPAVLCIILAIVGYLFIRDTPFERGVLPDNVDEEVYKREYCTEDIDDDGGWTTAKLLKTKELWLVAFVTGLLLLVTGGIMSQLVVRNQELGFSLKAAVTAMSVLALIGVFGSWLFGAIDTKWGTKKTIYLFCAWYLAACLCNIMETKYSTYLSIFMIGMAVGGAANFTASLPASVFGRHGFKKVNSLLFPIQNLFSALGFVINGFALSHTGTLKTAYFVWCCVLVCAAILLSFLSEYKYNRDWITEKAAASA